MLRLSRSIPLVALAASMLGDVPPAHARREATVYAVNDFDGPLTCGGSDFEYATFTGGILRDLLEDWSYDESYLWKNRYLDYVDVTDTKFDSSGLDHRESSGMGIDSADVGMIYTHGKYSCSSSGAYSSLEMGDSAYDCWAQYADAGAAADSWWGDTDLNVMILDASHSAQRCVLAGGGVFNVEDNLVMVLGFHGVVDDSYQHLHDFWDFVEDSRRRKLGDNWIDELTRRPAGSNNDRCAVAVVYEDSKSEADATLDGMSWFTWHYPGAHERYYYYYIKNCDPLRGNKL